MSELLKYIRLGIQGREFFLYDNQKIVLRPLTSHEFDLCEEKSYNEVDAIISKFIMRVRLGDVKITDEIRNLSPEVYTRMTKYYNSIDYWIVYFSMKDFMPEDFSIDDVMNMKNIHEIASVVFKISSIDDETIIDEVATEDGQSLATIIYKLHQPLVSDLWKLTPLQHKFLLYAHPNSIKKVADSWDEFVQKRRNGEILKNVNN